MKIVYIPFDENWFLGGNHYFASFVKDFQTFVHPDIKFLLDLPENSSNISYDAILSVRCHIFEEQYRTLFNSVPIFLYHDDYHYFKFRRFFNSKEFYSILENVNIFFSTFYLLIGVFFYRQ
jgi:hypothetical protein